MERDQREFRLMVAALVAAIFIAYSPLFLADFTSWDDLFNVGINPRFNPPTWRGVAYYWQHPAFDLYIPVTYSLWGLIARLGYLNAADPIGSHLNPMLFHAANIVLHAIA